MSENPKNPEILEPIEKQQDPVNEKPEVKEPQKEELNLLPEQIAFLKEVNASPLIFAIVSDHINKVKKIIKEKNVDLPDDSDFLPLMYAIFSLNI